MKLDKTERWVRRELERLDLKDFRGEIDRKHYDAKRQWIAREAERRRIAEQWNNFPRTGTAAQKWGR